LKASQQIPIGLSSRFGEAWVMEIDERLSREENGTTGRVVCFGLASGLATKLDWSEG
jgi:hypothetical protein